MERIGGRGRRAGARALTDALEDIRNVVGFHYDTEELRKGYEAFFARPSQEPMMSRGDNLVKSRFYFADAAAQEAMIGRSDKAKYFLEGNDVILRHIHQALFHLVAYFVQLRTGRAPRFKQGRRRGGDDLKKAPRWRVKETLSSSSGPRRAPREAPALGRAQKSQVSDFSTSHADASGASATNESRSVEQG